MAQIELTIRKPANGTVFIQPSIEFQGQATVCPELAGVQLYFRWYASLNQISELAIKNSQFALNPSPLPDAGTPFSAELPMGSHVITFAASDQFQESDLVSSRHGGVAGGVNKQGIGHLIHVLKANIVAPTGATTVGVSSSTRFCAEAPWPFDDEDYQAVNGLRFSWVFEAMSGDQPDPNRPSITADQERMTFKSPPPPQRGVADPPVLELDPDTYKDLHGTYRATLLVEAGSPKIIAPPESIYVEFP